MLIPLLLRVACGGGYLKATQWIFEGRGGEEVICRCKIFFIEYTEFIKPGASMESRHFRRRQKNIKNISFVLS